MIVADTNVIVGLFLPTGWSADAERLLLRQPQWVAPLLWRSEFRNVLATYVRVGRLDLDAALETVEAAELLMAGREFSVGSLAVLRLAAESDCTTYDCEYVALSASLDIPLVTNDKRLLEAFPGRTMSLAVASSAGESS